MQALSFISAITPPLCLNIASHLWRSPRNILHSSAKRFTELSTSEASSRARSNVAALVHSSSMLAWNSSLTTRSSSLTELRPSIAFLSLSLALAFAVEVCFRLDLYPKTSSVKLCIRAHNSALLEVKEATLALYAFTALAELSTELALLARSFI